MERRAVEEPQVQRRLAAIVAVDVAGYSRLVGIDEEGTLARLKALRRDLVDVPIARHRGRIVKTMGDGILIEFASIVDAVRCALEVQTSMAQGNAGLKPEQRIEFRVGIHLGDVVVEGEDLLGDGVNIAARLEGIAEPGGICLSRAAYEQIEGKIEVAAEDLGEQSLKNIKRPVRAYLIDAKAASLSGRNAPQLESALPLPDKPSIVVLAFANMSGDSEPEYFSDGLAEDIITDLSKLSSLFVISRNSAFVYKGKPTDVRRISRDLGVRYVLAGSVRKSGNRVRVTAQLTDGTTGTQLWAERYDRNLSDIFAVQDELTADIVAALSLRLNEKERRRFNRKGTLNITAYESFLRGREAFFSMSRASIAAAQAELARSIALDPRFALPHAFMAATHLLNYTNGWGDEPEKLLPLAYEEASRAVTLDDLEPQAHFRLSSVLLWMRQHDRSIAAVERAIALDPNFADGYANLGRTLHYAGRSMEALPHFKTAMRLDPHYHDIVLHFQAEVLFRLGRFADAAECAKRRILRNPATDISRVLLAACYGQLGEAAAARSAWTDALRANPAYSLELRRRTLPYKNPDDFEFLIEGLRKAGLPD
jgi:adenylate cyclase